jgi:sulfite reductase beta subunit-like hemoprotein
MSDATPKPPPSAPIQDASPPAKAENKVEAAKRASNYLRGTIAATLADPSQASFVEDDTIAMKFHGIYQQDDRDQRVARAKQGLDKAYSFMIRICAPGGIVSARQYLDIDRIAGTHANGTLRLTTRQAFQLHGVTKGNLRDTMRAINWALMTSLAACGDVPRNVMASPAPYATPVHRATASLVRELAKDLAPRTGAYHEIWVDGEAYSPDDDARGAAPAPCRARSGAQPGAQPESSAKEEEPLFGSQYLPRKFKLGVAIDFDNGIDIYAYDAGLLAVTSDNRVLGYNLLVGGGLGMTHNRPETIARVASPIAFVPESLAIRAMRTVVEIYRDHGDRSERRLARIKYLMERWGVERFREELERRLGVTLEAPRAVAPPRQLDHIGRFDQGDGREFLGVFVENGRIADTPKARYRSAFREIVGRHAPGIRLTPMQSILFTDLTREMADDIERILAEHGVAPLGALSHARRWSMACVALPTCGLALTDAERQLPSVIDEFERELASLGLADVPLTIRMTGCPNGCARPYNADIGLVGRKPGVYHVFVGGGLGGDRLADLYLADVPVGEVLPKLRPLLQRFARDRSPGESLSDFYRRLYDRPRQRALLTGRETPTAPLVQLTVSA